RRRLSPRGDGDQSPAGGETRAAGLSRRPRRPQETRAPDTEDASNATRSLAPRKGIDCIIVPAPGHPPAARSGRDEAVSARHHGCYDPICSAGGGMKVYAAPNIRNVAVVGHGGCGKTSLVSALLFDTGAVNRLGRIEDGTTATDFDPDEIERRISLQTALAYGEWRKTKLNLLDAPGYANFLSEARSALRVADAAIVVVDAGGRARRGCRGADREGLGLRPRLRDPPADRRQPDGPRAGFLPEEPRVPAAR